MRKLLLAGATSACIVSVAMAQTGGTTSNGSSSSQTGTGAVTTTDGTTPNNGSAGTTHRNGATGTGMNAQGDSNAPGAAPSAAAPSGAAPSGAAPSAAAPSGSATAPSADTGRTDTTDGTGKPADTSAASKDRTGPKEPAKGANSFTQSQAQSRIADAGYTAVADLKKDGDGVWRGSAMKDGQKVNVWLDYKGNVGQQ